MTTKTITIKKEAYRRLKELKKGKKSFSDVVMELTGKRDFRSGFGKWKGSKRKLEKVVKEEREKFQKDFEERENVLFGN